ncbi:DUF1931 family protein [Streptomyces asiaticus]
MRCAAPGRVVPGPVTSAEAAGAHAAGGKTVTARPHSCAPATAPALTSARGRPSLRRDRTPTQETEERYPEIIGGLSVALAETFKIMYPDVTNPQTSHWEGVAAVFDRLLSQSRPGACRRTGLACRTGSEGGDWKPAPRPGSRRRCSGTGDRPFSAVGHLGQENHTRSPSHHGVRRGRSFRGSVSSRDALTRQGKT